MVTHFDMDKVGLWHVREMFNSKVPDFAGGTSFDHITSYISSDFGYLLRLPWPDQLAH